MIAIEWDPGSIFEHVLRRVHGRTRAPLPQIDLQFRPFTGMNHRARLRKGLLEVRLSDLIREAEPRVMEALAVILLAKLYRREVPDEMRERYRKYILSRSVEERILETRRARGRKVATPPQGAHHDLAAIFGELNARYFSGAIPGVSLGWSRRASKVRLGHFDAAHRAIVISRSLDRASVPRLVVEYILYHEMLHVKHPVVVAGGRRGIHTAAFHAEERRFEGYASVRKMLRAMALASTVD